ncbi:MAG: EsaB/YukD family protein [Lachnospiraceae bacterium]|nr:EsaB/YukD family protein [Lachnospiraceae bacterium]
MILVDIRVPALDDSYDFLLDENTPVDKVLMEIIEMIGKKQQSNEKLNADDFLLYNYKKGTQLKLADSLFESGIRDGDCLLLI